MGVISDTGGGVKARIGLGVSGIVSTLTGGGVKACIGLGVSMGVISDTGGGCQC